MTVKRSPITAAMSEKLLRAARSARKNAHAPYSRFAVGAAIISSSGKTYKGANVENASFGATICAERAAILAAVTNGDSKFKAIAVVADGKKPPIPCGACLQVMAEFCGPDFLIILATPSTLKPIKRFLLSDLLPETFTFTK
jgi:cytidine deaminase